FLRVDLDDGESLPTATGLWSGASFLERETFDMMGVVFDGHPDLRKLLTPEDLEGHPHRKDFPLGETPTLFGDGRFLDPASFRAGLSGRDPGLTGWKGGARDGVVASQTHGAAATTRRADGVTPDKGGSCATPLPPRSQGHRPGWVSSTPSTCASTWDRSTPARTACCASSSTSTANGSCPSDPTSATSIPASRRPWRTARTNRASRTPTAWITSTASHTT